MATVVSKHPILAYYVLAFGISWGGVLVLLGAPATLIASAGADSREFMLGLVLTLTGPPVASIVITGIVEGGRGFSVMFRRLLVWRTSPRWYAVAFLSAPVSVSLSLLVLSRFSDEFVPGYVGGGGIEIAAMSSGGTAVLALGAGVVTGFLEEVGWTGFAIPRLTQRYGVVLTGVIVGFLWGAWHLVSNLWGSGPNARGMPLILYIAGLLFTFLPPFRVLMVWVYERSQSLPLAMLMHASLVFFWLISTPHGIAGRALISWYLTWGLLLWLTVAVLVVPGSRTRPSERLASTST